MNTPHKPIIDRVARKARGESPAQCARRLGISVVELLKAEQGDFSFVSTPTIEKRNIVFPSAEPARIVDGAERPIYVDLAKPGADESVEIPFKEVLGFKVYPTDENGETLCTGKIEFAKGGIDKVAEGMLQAANPELPGLKYSKGKVTIPAKAVFTRFNKPVLPTHQEFAKTQADEAKAKAIKRKKRQIGMLQARWDNIRAYWEAKLASEHEELAKLQK